MKKQILIVTAAALTAVVILNGTRAATAQQTPQYEVGGFPITPLQCWRCSPPLKSKSSSALVGNAQWTLPGVPWFAIPVSPIRAGKPAPLVDVRFGSKADMTFSSG